MLHPARTVAVAWILGVLLLAAEALAVPTPAPRFTWAAFRHFWNVYCLPGMDIKNFERGPEGFQVYYGNGVSLVAVMDKDNVSGVRLKYACQPGQESGGRAYLRLIESAMRVGTYQWDQARSAAVRKTFENMTPDLKTFEWKNSRFSRQQFSTGAWVFSLDFIPSKE